MNNDENIDLVSRDSRTPTTESTRALAIINGVFSEKYRDLLVENGEDPEKFFFEKILMAVRNDPQADGDKRVLEHWESINCCPEGAVKFDLLTPLLIATTFVVQTARAIARRDNDKAWGYVSSAMYWAGFSEAASLDYQGGPYTASAMAAKRHAENRAMSSEAEEYWKQNMDHNLSAQAAANELMKVVPLSHKTLASIVSAAKKGMKQTK